MDLVEHNETNVDNDDDLKGLEEMQRARNRKQKKSGGFQAMGLSPNVFKGIMRKGYKLPTPIQRKTIPLILSGCDVVSMARTGSGKTACFLIPLFERLKARSAQSGARALILSPTRELALQTHTFTKELGRFTGLRSVCILGGASMERQFGLMHEHPDILIATPGRFVHLCVEMGLQLTNIEYVVMDEADRLFEMGLGEQLRELLARLPESRQTLLFSATLPKMLVDFAKAGLNQPVLIRLDVDNKLPDTLSLAFVHCRDEAKLSALLHLLTHVINEKDQTIVFCATRHHVEYIHQLLTTAGLKSTFIYSQLDAEARRLNASSFAQKKRNVLVVTDLAARGIDLPLLDNVINFNFPSRPKLFVHRVGRVARAGRHGTAYSLVAGDELAYFIDLQLFLGHSCSTMTDNNDQQWHNKLAALPHYVFEEYADTLDKWHESQPELESMKKVASNGFVQYLKSRPSAAPESVKRARNVAIDQLIKHPIFNSENKDQNGTNDKNEMSQSRKMAVEREEFLLAMKSFKPSNTILEIRSRSKGAQSRGVMAEKRVRDDVFIAKHKEEQRLKVINANREDNEENVSRKEKMEESSQADLESTFSSVIVPSTKTRAKVFKAKTKKSTGSKVDEENYINYRAKDHLTEAGLSLRSSFETAANEATLDLDGDDFETRKRKQNAMRWDVKKKKYVRGQDLDGKAKEKKIKTESGVWIPASYKSDRYAKWKERRKVDHIKATDEDEETPRSKKMRMSGPIRVGAATKEKSKKGGVRSELKGPEQILKARQRRERMRKKNAPKKKR